MYGYISNNINQKIESYLKNKNILIDVTINEQIKNELVFDKLISDFENLNFIIVDSSSFYSDEIAINCLYKLKSKYLDIRIILISFSKNLLTKAAMIGIYDIIKFDKMTNLDLDLDHLILTPNTLVDIQEYLNPFVISDKKNATIGRNNIMVLSNNKITYQTSTLISLLKTMTSDCHPLLVSVVDSKILSKFSELIISCELTKMPIIKQDNYDILLIDNKVGLEEILRVFVSYDKLYDMIIFDIGYENINLYNHLETYIDFIWIFERNDLYRDFDIIKNLEIEQVKIKKVINSKQIYVHEKFSDIEQLASLNVENLENYFKEFYKMENNKYLKKVFNKINIKKMP